jgi:8-oxo-dGTP diphosphatase
MMSPPRKETHMIRVVAGLIQRKGRLLICQRRPGGVFTLQWEFPGGKLQPGETPRAGLARELREELGCAARIGAQVWRALHRYREFAEPLEIAFFVVRDVWPAPRNRAFAQIAWVRPGDLLRYDFLPADRELVTRLARGELARKLRPVWSGRHPQREPAR